MNHRLANLVEQVEHDGSTANFPSLPRYYREVEGEGNSLSDTQGRGRRAL